MADELSDDELDALGSVGHGAVLSFGGVSLQKALLFLTNLALTAGLTVELYGVYALGRRISKILLQFGPFGSSQALVRFLPEYRDDPARRNRILGLAYATAFLTSLLLAAGLFLAADRVNALTIDHPQFPLVLRLFAVLLPFDVFVRLLGFLFRALEMVEYQLFVRRIARPGVRLAALVLALVSGFSLAGLVGAFAVATAVVAVLALWIAHTRTDLSPAPGAPLGEATEFYNHAAPNTLSKVGRLFRNRIDVLLIGFLLSADAAGIYNLALFLTSIVAIPLISFNQLLPPVASRLYADGDLGTLGAVYSTVTRLVFTGTVVVAVTEVVYGPELLGLFGEGYTEGALVLLAFVAGRVVSNAVGATGWLLLMTDHQYLRMVNSWVLGVLNVAFSYYFILEFGLIGAALGTAGSLALVNVVRLGQLWYLEGLQPFDARFLKPLGAGAGMAATMLALKPFLSGAVLLAGGTSLGLAVFAALLYAFGIERRDRQLVGVLFARYRIEPRRLLSRSYD